MSLKNSDLQYYDGNILRLSSEKRKEYHAQVDNLIAELRKHITVNSDLKVKKVVKAGSFAKFTILKKTAEHGCYKDIVECGEALVYFQQCSDYIQDANDYKEYRLLAYGKEESDEFS